MKRGINLLTLILLIISSFHLEAQQVIEHKDVQPLAVEEKSFITRAPKKQRLSTSKKAFIAITGITAALLSVYGSYRWYTSGKKEDQPGQHGKSAQPSSATQPDKAPSAQVQPVPSQSLTYEETLHNNYDELVTMFKDQRKQHKEIEIDRSNFIIDTLLPMLRDNYPTTWQTIQVNRILPSQAPKTFDTVINKLNLIINTENDVQLQQRYYQTWINYYITFFTNNPTTPDDYTKIEKIHSQTFSLTSH